MSFVVIRNPEQFKNFKKFFNIQGGIAEDTFHNVKQKMASRGTYQPLKSQGTVGAF